MKKPKKKVTMEGIAGLITKSHDSLARAVAEGFRGSDRRFEAVDKRFDAMDKRFDGMSQQIRGLENRIDELALNRATREELNVLDKRVGRIETKLGIDFKKPQHV